MILTYMGLIIATILLGGCGVSYRSSIRRLEAKKSSLDYLVNLADEQKRELEEEAERKIREEQLQKTRKFQLDFKITHGSAFGGCSAISPDGRHRKGTIALSQIQMFGKNPAGQEFTYYIEDQKLSILARDDANSLMICSEGQPFVIREANTGRDQGTTTKEAVIYKDVLYYLILESKHELSIKASKVC